MIDRTALERRLHTKLADWCGLLTRNLATGRDVLRLVLAGPIRFTPVSDECRRGYRFEGAIALDRMIGGVLETYPNGTSPEGPDRRWKVHGDTREAEPDAVRMKRHLGPLARQ